MRRRKKFAARLMLGALCVAGAASLPPPGQAHEDGAPHAEPAAAVESFAAPADRPAFDASGRLHVSKSVQHLLGIRTAAAAAPVETLIRSGEVLTQPDAAGAVPAPQAGRVAAAGDAPWPVAGQRVAAGEVLGMLVPQMTQRDVARRRALLAQIEAKLVIARINVARLQVQADSGAAGEPARNIYLEQSKTELSALERLEALQKESIAGRMTLSASVAGVLASVGPRPGDVVAAGDAVFDIVPDAPARIAVTVFDPGLAERLRSATAAIPPGAPSKLVLRGQEPLSSGTGWRLLFDAAAGTRTLLPGELVRVTIEAAPGAAACAVPAAATWVHVAPEWFERRADAPCEVPREGERRVVQGAALLDAYR